MKLKSIEITEKLFSNLWDKYAMDVTFAGKTNELLKSRNQTPVFDHLKFRTLNTHTGEQPEGIESIMHLAEILGYRMTAKYTLHNKLITAAVLKHESNLLPLILVSQFEVNHLQSWAQKAIADIVSETSYGISDNGIELLGALQKTGSLPVEACNYLLSDLTGYFGRPWGSPPVEVIRRVIEVAPYCAWVLLFGNSVSRMSLSVKSFSKEGTINIEQVGNLLNANGIHVNLVLPIEGYENLQQAETLKEKVYAEVSDDDGIQNIKWEYASLHITERFEMPLKAKSDRPEMPLFPE